MPSVAEGAAGPRTGEWPVLAAVALAAAASGLAAVGWAAWHQRAPAFPPSVLRYSIELADTRR